MDVPATPLLSCMLACILPGGSPIVADTGGMLGTWLDVGGCRETILIAIFYEHTVQYLQ